MDFQHSVRIGMVVFPPLLVLIYYTASALAGYFSSGAASTIVDDLGNNRHGSGAFPDIQIYLFDIMNVLFIIGQIIAFLLLLSIHYDQIKSQRYFGFFHSYYSILAFTGLAFIDFHHVLLSFLWTFIFSYGVALWMYLPIGFASSSTSSNTSSSTHESPVTLFDHIILLHNISILLFLVGVYGALHFNSVWINSPRMASIMERIVFAMLPMPCVVVMSTIVAPVIPHTIFPWFIQFYLCYCHYLLSLPVRRSDVTGFIPFSPPKQVFVMNPDQSISPPLVYRKRTTSSSSSASSSNILSPFQFNSTKDFSLPPTVFDLAGSNNNSVGGKNRRNPWHVREWNLYRLILPSLINAFENDDENRNQTDLEGMALQKSYVPKEDQITGISEGFLHLFQLYMVPLTVHFEKHKHDEGIFIYQSILLLCFPFIYLACIYQKLPLLWATSWIGGLNQQSTLLKYCGCFSAFVIVSTVGLGSIKTDTNYLSFSITSIFLLSMLLMFILVTFQYSFSSTNLIIYFKFLYCIIIGSASYHLAEFILSVSQISVQNLYIFLFVLASVMYSFEYIQMLLSKYQATAMLHYLVSSVFFVFGVCIILFTFIDTSYSISVSYIASTIFMLLFKYQLLSSNITKENGMKISSVISSISFMLFNISVCNEHSNNSTVLKSLFCFGLIHSVYLMFLFNQVSGSRSSIHKTIVYSALAVCIGSPVIIDPGISLLLFLMIVARTNYNLSEERSKDTMQIKGNKTLKFGIFMLAPCILLFLLLLSEPAQSQASDIPWHIKNQNFSLSEIGVIVFFSWAAFVTPLKTKRSLLLALFSTILTFSIISALFDMKRGTRLFSSAILGFLVYLQQIYTYVYPHILQKWSILLFLSLFLSATIGILYLILYALYLHHGIAIVEPKRKHHIEFSIETIVTACLLSLTNFFSIFFVLEVFSQLFGRYRKDSFSKTGRSNQVLFKSNLNYLLRDFLSRFRLYVLNILFTVLGFVLISKYIFAEENLRPFFIGLISPGEFSTLFLMSFACIGQFAIFISITLRRNLLARQGIFTAQTTNVNKIELIIWKLSFILGCSLYFIVSNYYRFLKPASFKTTISVLILAQLILISPNEMFPRGFHSKFAISSIVTLQVISILLFFESFTFTISQLLVSIILYLPVAVCFTQFSFLFWNGEYFIQPVQAWNKVYIYLPLCFLVGVLSFPHYSGYLTQLSIYCNFLGFDLYIRSVEDYKPHKKDHHGME